MLSASQLKAGNEAYLYAGQQLALLAAQNSDYSLYDKKKKGGWGSKETQRDEVTTVRNVGSSITTGGNLSLISEGDQLYQKARLESGNDLILDSGGSITFEAVKDLDQESHEKSSNSLAWTSAKGKGTTDETLYQSQLIAKGDLVIQAVDGLKIDVKEVNQQSVTQTIDAMVKADPELAWLKEMEQRGDVDWRRVKEVHDAFKYSHSGLGGAAAMVIAIVVAYFTAGAASGLVASGASAAGATTATAAGGAWAAGTGATLSGIGWANAAVTAGLTGMASNGAVSTINNRGNLGAVFKDVTSEDALRGYAVAGITAGLTNGLYDRWLGTETGSAGAIQNGGKVIANGGLSTVEGIGRFAGNQLLQNGTSTVLDRALGGDSSFSDALRSSLANTFAAAGFNWVGDQTSKSQWDLKDGSPAKIAMHAVMGGLAAEAAGGDFKTGALAAGVNELLVAELDAQYKKMSIEDRNALLVMNSQVIGVLAAAAQGGDEKALQVGAQVAGAATQYNYLFHAEIEQMLAEQDGCANQTCKSQIAERYAELDSSRNAELAALCDSSPGTCDAILTRLMAEEPAILEMAKNLAGEGKIGAALVIGASIAPSNSSAMLTIASELGANSEFQAALGDLVLAGATGGLGRAGGTKRPSAVGGDGSGPKGTGTVGVADDAIKALPGPRQIDASWSASTYNKGGLMTGIEHVFYRHGPDSGFSNVSKFSQGTSLKDVSSYVDSALRYGKVSPNGPGGYVIEYNAGKIIGTNAAGAPTSTIKVNVRDGVIQTAFPL
ncbi:DUF637 domain-containing protein [Pseudomonas chaetocerotis]|uniref:DUF637 domain-containing protein n=1 Tax=Pseudomonas chaetocerotis TaxID=2758695 RepID=UPI002961FC1D|nr:DUF637 domain-containing protein [Pseudomonas chaetocerotis]